MINTHAAISVHITEVSSIYAQDNSIYDLIEYEINALTTIPTNVKYIIDTYSHYALPEFIYEEINCSKEIAK